MATFVTKPTAKITAQLSDSTADISIAGVTTADTLTAENAVTQINKVLDIVGQSIVQSGMKRILTQEVSSNE